MERKFTGREYNFDPTAHKALAHVTRELRHPRLSHTTTQPDNVPSDEASSEDLERFTNTIFKPSRVISNREIRRLRWQARFR